MFQLEREESKLSSSTIADWFSYFRCVCSDHYLRNSTPIGGPGTIIEIDETCLSRRKYNRGETSLSDI